LIELHISLSTIPTYYYIYQDALWSATDENFLSTSETPMKTGWESSAV